MGTHERAVAEQAADSRPERFRCKPGKYRKMGCTQRCLNCGEGKVEVRDHD